METLSRWQAAAFFLAGTTLGSILTFGVAAAIAFHYDIQ